MSRVVSSLGEFYRWLGHEREIDRVVYFVGDLGRFRKVAGRSIRSLGRIKGRSIAQEATLERLRGQLDLCSGAMLAAMKGRVVLVQRRGGSGWVYYAVRKKEEGLDG